MTHECPECGCEMEDKNAPVPNGHCSLCRQPYDNLVQHYDTCTEWKKTRMVMRGGWPRVCPEDGELYDGRYEDSHAARFHHW